MQGKDWLYYLLDSTGKSYRVENGLVVAKSSPKPLPNTPDGWQDITIGWERNISKWGVNRNFSLPLGFVLDGAQILRHLFYTKNFEQIVYLLIQKQTLVFSPTNYYFFHKFFYKGELDMSTFSREENKVEVNIMEGGLSKDLKANENTTYQIPVDELYVKMDGVSLKQTATWIFGNGNLPDNLEPNIPELTLVNTEAIQTLGARSTERTVVPFGPSMDSTGEYVLEISGETTLTIEWDFGITLSLIGIGALPNPHYLFQLRGFDIDGNEVFGSGGDGENLVDYTADPLLFYASHRFIGTATYTIPNNVKHLYLRSTVSTLPDFTEFVYDTEDSQVSMSYFYLHRTTYIKANTPLTTYKRLVGKITGSEADGESSLLTLKPNLVVTSGDAIRGIANAVSKSSLNDFFTSYNVILNAGLGIEDNKIMFESKRYFFDDSIVTPLGQVIDCTEKLAIELMYNTIKIGYPNQDYKDVNGRQEFNTTQIRTSDVKRVIKELDLVSKYRADMYGIEFTRINLDGKTTTDDEADNDTFVINIDYDNPQTLAEDTDGIPAGTTYYNLKRETYDSITGLLSPASAFNIEELTPKRLLEKHRDYLDSIFYGFESSALRFQSTDKNAELYTQKGTTIYDEDANYTVTGNERIFKPLMFEHSPQTPTDLAETMRYHPNMCFSFVHPNGNTYKGFNMKIGIAPNTLEEQVFQLISHEDNDLATLK